MVLRNSSWSIALMFGFPLLTLVVLICFVPPASTLSAERYGMTPATYDDWRRNHGRFARACLPDGEGGYHVLPMYHRRYPSSVGMTVRGAKTELTRRVKEHMFGDGPLVQTRIIKPPDAEAEALAMPLPALEVGQYGYVHSVEVEEVLGPESMVVEDVWLIDEDAVEEAKRADERRAGNDDRAEAVIEAMYAQREALIERQDEREFRRAELKLTGFKTAGAVAGERWAGPDGEGLQIAVVGYETYGSERRPEHRLLARPASDFGEGISETQFIELLEQRGLTPTQFVELIMQEHRGMLDREQADRAVFVHLLPADPEQAD
jgi:hypothetical protein